ncbi:MAG: DUF4116 domain-containing protein [Proteobacteria bacterium]|nr:DUF4116 domain-containing protein [Pseudomonadota bacterium]
MRRFIFVIFSLISSSVFAQEACNNIPAYYDQILSEVAKKNPQAISSLYDCFKRDRTLILKASVIDPSQFQNADESLQEDQVFILRLLKISSEVLQYAAPELRLDPFFMEKATYLNRYALQYASWTLLDNKLFMQRMIDLDPINYKFASDRLKLLPEFASKAFLDNGLLLEFAPQKIKEDKKLVKIAISSNSSAFEFAADSLKTDSELKKLAVTKTSIKSPENLQKFLSQNYFGNAEKEELGKVIKNQGKFFSKNKIIDRDYVTKWQRISGGSNERWQLIAANSRNYQNSWRKDFKKYPELAKKIEKFFLSHEVAENTLENLTTVFLWGVKKDPLTLVFNVYLVRDSTDQDLGPDFVDVSSLTAIAQKRKGKWEMTVIEVIFDSEERTDISYEDGLKRYNIWDLYVTDKKDKNPKIIFKVSDKFREYFEVFEEQKNGKYQKILTSDKR